MIKSSFVFQTTVLALIAALILAGCSSDENSGVSTSPESENKTAAAKVSDKPVIFTMLYSGEFNKDYKCLEIMKERTNVSLDIQAVPDSDYYQKSRLLISTGQIPDIVSKTSPSTEMCLSGTLLPISDYFDEMPNYMKFIEENNLQYLLGNARQIDGKIYQLPVNTKEVRTASKQIMIRKDIFDKNNLSIPATYDELYESCKKLKAIYKDSQPISVLYGDGNLLDMVAPSFGTSAGWSAGRYGFHYLEDKDRWIYAPVTEEYKGMLQYLNKCYTEGILDKEWARIDYNQYVKNASADHTFVLIAEWLGMETQYNKTLQQTNPDAKWVPIFPLKGTADKAYVYRVNNSTQTMVLSSKVKEKKYFPEFIRWLDWMYTGEAADLWTWGVEGETYNIDANGNKYYLPHVMIPNNPSGTEDIAVTYGVRNNCFTFIYPYDEEQARMPEEYRALIKEEVEKGAVPEIEPNIILSEEDAKKEKIYAENLQDYASQMIEKFIMGSESFDNWDRFIEECSSRGADILEKLYNNSWQKAKKKN
jgi:putative aldouronate transport system substrate-binding protein